MSFLLLLVLALSLLFLFLHQFRRRSPDPAAARGWSSAATHSHQQAAQGATLTQRRDEGKHSNDSTAAFALLPPDSPSEPARLGFPESDSAEFDSDAAGYAEARLQSRIEFTLLASYQLLAENLRSGLLDDGGYAGVKRAAVEAAREQAPLNSDLASVAGAYPHYEAEDVELGSLERFKHIMMNTQCIFARKARVWGSRPIEVKSSSSSSSSSSSCRPSFPSVTAQTLAALPGFVEFTLRVKESYPLFRAGSNGSQWLNESDSASFLTADTRELLEWKTPLSQFNLDAFVVEISGAEYSSTVPQFAQTVRDVLSALSFCDPRLSAASEADLESNNGIDVRLSQSMAPLAGVIRAELDAAPDPEILLAAQQRANTAFGSSRWHFSFLGESFFVTCFAPCFPDSHPRYAFGDEVGGEAVQGRCYVLLQPELAFLRRNLSPDTPHTYWKQPRTERDRIRVAFRDAGRLYVIPESVSYPSAHHMVPPLDVFSGEVVRWWQKQPEAEEKQQQRESQIS